MKRKQKLFAVLMATAMLLLFAACTSTPKEPVPENPFTTDKMGNLSFTYAADLATVVTDKVIRVDYNEDAFFMTMMMSVNLLGEEKFNDVVAAGLIKELSAMFDQSQWENGKMVTDVRSETVGDIGIWSAEFECDLATTDVKFKADITLGVYDEEVVVFIMVSKDFYYPEAALQFADTIQSLQPAV